MIVIYGWKTYGKVDRVPNLFYVCTQFFHVYWVPLIPLRSYVVLEGSEHNGSFQGVRTALSLRSILAGWWRAFLALLIVFGLVGGIGLAVQAVEGRRALTAFQVVFPWLLFLGGVAAYWLSKRFSRAGLGRARELATQLGLHPLLAEKVWLRANGAHEEEGTEELPGEAA